MLRPVRPILIKACLLDANWWPRFPGIGAWRWFWGSPQRVAKVKVAGSRDRQTDWHMPMQRGVCEYIGLAPSSEQRAGKEPAKRPAMGVSGDQGSVGIGRASPTGEGILGLLVEIRTNDPGGAAQLGEGCIGLVCRAAR